MTMRLHDIAPDVAARIATDARLCELAYDTAAERKYGARRADCYLVGDLSADDTDAFVFYDSEHDERVVVFRGTETCLSGGRHSWSDLFSNLGYAQRWGGDGRVHSGYNLGSGRVLPAVFCEAETAKADRMPLRLAGHSLGGAIALILALWLCRDEWAHLIDLPTQVATFGAPPAMDERARGYLAACDVPAYRVADRWDFAPRLPLPGLVHAGELVRVSTGRWPRPLTRHGMGRYRAAVLGQLSALTARP